MSTPERPRFQQLQYALAAHVRDPERVAAPEDLEERRVRIYRDLLFNNMSSLLASTYPVLRRMYRTGPEGEAGWQALVREFFVTHRARTPLFPEVPGEFLGWLRDTRGLRTEDPPFLLELAHYEWVELALSVAEEEIDDVPADGEGDLLNGRPVLSPLAWPLAYAWPVHRLRPDFRPEAPGGQPTCLVVYRRRDYTVGFMEINPVTAHLMALIGEAPPEATGRSLLERIAQEIGHPDPQTVVNGGREILRTLRERDIVLGTAP